ncbi:hypothetical protein IQ225_00410, partial [Synechocystis salina LEGE 06155]|nr:hypothetical protein [Synechocystis salina LEGE 06155]
MTINLADRLSAVTTDSAGTTHIVWVENASLWHAVYNVNAGTWDNAQAIANVGNQSLTSLNLIANDKLIGGDSPGLAVVYQQGTDNESDFFYTAAQYNTSGKLQWLASPQNLSADQVGDLEPRAIANNDGTVFVVGQKVNTDNANNFSNREDTDLYYQSFTVSSSQFPTPTPPPVNTNNAVYTTQILASPLANPKRKSNTKVFQGSGFNWNGSQYFDTNLLEFNLLNQSPSQPNGYLGNLFKSINIAGSLQAASGGKNPELTLINGANGPLLNVAASVSYQNTNAQGKDFQGNFGPSNYFSASANFSTLYNYASTPNSDGYYPLANQKGTMGVSFGLKIPLYQEPPFFINFLGSAGASFQWQLSPSSSSYTPLLSPYLAPNSSGSDAILTASIGVPPAGAVEAIALALLSDITEIIRRSDGDLKLDGLDVSIPVAAGLAGGINIPLLFQAILSGQVYVNGKFSFAQSTPDQGALTLGLPVRLTVKTLGFLGGTLEYFPEWKWTWNLASSSSSAPALLSANPLTSSTTTANVQGSLLTITFPNALANNLALNPDDFTVTVTDINGLISFIPVFGLVIQENTNSVILRLEQTIPYTSHNDLS